MNLAIPIVFAVLAAMLGLGAAPANAATNSLLITVVSDVGGAPIPNTQILIQYFDGTNFTTVPGGDTDVNGTFLLSNASLGQYQLYFYGPNSAWAPEAYNNQYDYSNADWYTLAAGASNLTIGLSPAATISGTVTQTGGGFPSGGYVEAYPYSSAGGVSYSSSGSGQIDASGNYTVSALAPGQFVLRVRPPTGSAYVDLYYPNVYNPAAATPITVTVGQQRTGFNMQLALGATISGTVTGPSSVAAAGVTVEVWGPRAVYGDIDVVGSAVTDSSGLYSIPGLTPGSYSLRFNAFGTPWSSDWFDNKSDALAATPIVLTSAQVRSATNTQLVAGATISGTITDAVTHLGLAGTADVFREKSDSTWERVGYATANASGQYNASGLSAGTYRVALEGTGTDYAIEYTGASYYADTAEQIVLAAGATSGGHDGALVGGVSIHLNARDKTSHLPVNAWSYIEIERSPGVWAVPTTGYGSGDIGLSNEGGLPPGTYRIHWEDQSGAGYLNQWWNNEPTASAADLVTLAPGASFTGTANMSKTATVPVSPAPVPTISGVPQLGNTLTAQAGAWGPASVQLTYQWYVNGVAKSGAIDSTFVVGVDEVGFPITVAVTGASDGYVSVTQTSDPVTVTAQPVSPAPVPTIVGVPQVGNTLTAQPGTWGPAPVGLSYQWSINGVAKSGATASTFVLGADAVGFPVTVAVTGAKAGYVSVTQTSGATSAVVQTFADVSPGSLFITEMTWMYTSGISTGYTDESGYRIFKPLAPVTRQAMAAFLYRAAHSPTFTAPSTPYFSDVPTTAPFFKEIEWMKAQGITTGTANGDGTFSYKPNDPVSRQAMATFLYRAAGSPAYTPPTTPSFTDVAANASIYLQVEWMKANAISTGTSNGDGTYSFKPLDPVSRQAMSAFLYRSNPHS